jgi:D-3-phosphoglycerate dehydrogenase
MKVVVLDDYQDAWRRLGSDNLLAGHEVVIHQEAVVDTRRLPETLAGAEALLMIQQRTSLTRDMVEAFRELRLISLTGRNASHIDLAACADHGITVCASGAGRPQATAELTWGLIIAALRHIPDEVAALREGRWLTTLGTGLYGRTLGVYALGRIGSLIAQYGKAFGMDVMAWGRDSSADRARQLGVRMAATRRELFSTVDVLSIHIALVPETRGSITAEDLSYMKATALFVNTSRSQLMAPGALESALGRGRPGFAASDPLLRMPNVLCTPHLGYAERDTLAAYFQVAADQVNAFAAGSPINVIGR